MSDNYKRLYRARDERMIAGVCGGIGKYFNVDPTLVRLLFVFFAFAGGPGLLAYIILAIIVPEEPVEGTITVTTTEPDAQAPAEAEEAEEEESAGEESV
jgi:phage shock protein C